MLPITFSINHIGASGGRPAKQINLRIEIYSTHYIEVEVTDQRSLVPTDLILYLRELANEFEHHNRLVRESRPSEAPNPDNSKTNS